MAGSPKKQLSKAFSNQAFGVNVDDEWVFVADPKSENGVPSRKLAFSRLSDFFGRLLYGHHHASLRHLIATANEQCAAGKTADQRARVAAVVVVHARRALRHTVFARLALVTIFSFFAFVVTVVLAHETHNTYRISQRHIENPTLARSPEQSWGYTPVLNDLPGPLKSSLITFDQQVESTLLRLGAGRSASASRSIQSAKLGAILISLFCLVPLAQWGMTQFDLAQASRGRALKAADSPYLR